MRIFSLITALAALSTAVVGATLPREDNCGFEIGCELAQLASKRDFSGEHATGTVRGLTNAALLRRGLPLKNPIMRRGTPVRRINPSETPKPEPEPEPEPEPKTIVHRGIISVTMAGGGGVLGYVSATTLNGQYRYSDISSALIVTFETDLSGSGTQLNLVPESSASGFNFLGLVQGRDNANSVLSSGSYQYVYLASTDKTVPGSSPTTVGNSYTVATGLSRTSESAVWTFDSATGVLSPRWVNTDGSIPAVEYFVQSTAIYIGGDMEAFHSRYPAPVVPVVLGFISLQ